VGLLEWRMGGDGPIVWVGHSGSPAFLRDLQTVVGQTPPGHHGSKKTALTRTIEGSNLDSLRQIEDPPRAAEGQGRMGSRARLGKGKGRLQALSGLADESGARRVAGTKREGELRGRAGGIK
jgi:hypothetical protein